MTHCRRQHQLFNAGRLQIASRTQKKKGGRRSDLSPHGVFDGLAQAAAALVTGAPTSSSGVGRLGDGGCYAVSKQSKAVGAKVFCLFQRHGFAQIHEVDSRLLLRTSYRQKNKLHAEFQKHSPFVNPASFQESFVSSPLPALPLLQSSSQWLDEVYRPTRAHQKKPAPFF